MDFDAVRTVVSPTGARLRLYVKEAPGTPAGVVHISHGLAEHAARYARFAIALSAAGYVTYAHDHRGHGATQADGAPMGRFAPDGGVDKVLADVDAIDTLIAGERLGLPLVRLGHSMGAVIALNAVLSRSDHLAGAAIWNGNFSPGVSGRIGQALLAWERFRLGSDVPSRLLPALTFRAWARRIKDRRTEFDWLSQDPAEVDAYIADPLCGWDASVSMWQDIFRMVFRGADDRSFAGVRRDLPFHLVGGSEDPSTEQGQAVDELADRMRRMGFSNLVSRVYPQTRHEGLNDLTRDLVTADLIGWLDRITRSR
jgi:alpha-beta hydrolase superfamily lysophospholipase